MNMDKGGVLYPNGANDKPDDIPQRVFEEAMRIARWVISASGGHTDDLAMASEPIARAIMAETEACAVIADCDCEAGICEHREKADLIRARNKP